MNSEEKNEERKQFAVWLGKYWNGKESSDSNIEATCFRLEGEAWSLVGNKLDFDILRNFRIRVINTKNEFKFLHKEVVEEKEKQRKFPIRNFTTVIPLTNFSECDSAKMNNKTLTVLIKELAKKIDSLIQQQEFMLNYIE